MKKIKRIIALVCAMVMMMAMSTVSFAANSATVTIAGLDASVTQVQVTKVIGTSTSSKTGLAITNNEFRTALTSKYGTNKSDDELITSFKEASDTDRATLLDSVTTFTEAEIITLSNGTFTVSGAGLYVIKVPTDKQTVYKYNVMAAYVGVSYGRDGASTGVVGNVTVIAKGNKIKDNKSYNTTTDKTVEIGDTISYMVESTVPYIAKDDSDGKWEIHDTLTGGHFNDIVKATDDDAGENDVNVGKMRVKVKVGNADPTTYYVSVSKASNTESFVLNLKSVAQAVDTDGNYTNTNKNVEITYTAQATKTVINNEEYSDYGNNITEDNKSTVTSKTADIIVNKTTVAKDGEAAKPLAGAKFIIIKKVSSKTYYANLDENKTLSVENPWVEYTDVNRVPESAKIATEILGDVASATAHGFDGDQNDKYYVVETDAPTGYSLPANTEQAVTRFTADSTDNLMYKATVIFNDPELISLPMTGGMGTTLFTVLGVTIMVLAAALYLANKKKNAAN